MIERGPIEPSPLTKNIRIEILTFWFWNFEKVKKLMTEKEIKEEEQRIANLNEYYLELFCPPDEDNEGRKEFDKMKGLI